MTKTPGFTFKVVPNVGSYTLINGAMFVVWANGEQTFAIIKTATRR